MAANSGYIVVKDGEKGRRVSYKDFFGPLDKGAAKPSFCYPKRKEDLTEEIASMKRAIDNGHVSPDKKMAVQMDLKKREERLGQLNDQESAAKKLFNENKDKWMERRSQLAEEISQTMPTRTEKKKRIVNPHRVLQQEKGGLQDKKTEYVVISRLAGEESNTSYLQRD